MRDLGGANLGLWRARFVVIGMTMMSVTQFRQRAASLKLRPADRESSDSFSMLAPSNWNHSALMRFVNS